ncbi:cytochrome-c peroxidase [Lewinella sp. W8]|uniref:cytochrome-c peroxidase n=1 Tax=Lewinella sp. W8 TaxID=2528208 RepID=UPI001068B386|nr:cytochrome c peroxidase [Lewinella sp. W8]MTB51516.1 cytochrome-c peroxidase [Lewinella sp. W8]
MKQTTFLLLCASLLFFSHCQMEDDFEVGLDQQLLEVIQRANPEGRKAFILPEETDFDAIPQDPLNPITAEKVRLGRFLFHETGIGVEAVMEGNLRTYSCASCHFAGAGFQAGRFQGIGEGGAGFGVNGERRDRDERTAAEDLDVQPIRSPAALNTAYQEVMLWNGQFGATGINEGTEEQWTPNTPKENNFLGFQGIETQAIAGLGVHRLNMTPELAEELGYTTLFDAAFPNVSGPSRYSLLNAALAIAAYERTLLANEAPFQNWLRGNPNGLTDAEKRGAIVFFDKGNCVSCHSSPALNSMEFHALGMNDLFDCPEETFGTSSDNPANLGRGGFTLREEDNYKFKVPQLYNLSQSRFYGHGASLRSIRDVVVYKNMGVPEKSGVPSTQLAAGFQPLGLTEQEIDDLTAFLTTGLRDGNLRRYEPSTLPSGQCFPNADFLSQRDLDCL